MKCETQSNYAVDKMGNLFQPYHNEFLLIHLRCLRYNGFDKIKFFSVTRMYATNGQVFNKIRKKRGSEKKFINKKKKNYKTTIFN